MDKSTELSNQLIDELKELKEACIEDEETYRSEYEKYELVQQEAGTLADDYSYRAELISRVLKELESK